MPGAYDFFKDPKCRCNCCMDVIKPINNNDWVTCSCGSTSIKGLSILYIRGKNYTDLTQYNAENIPDLHPN